MVDAVVSFVVQRLGDYLIQEAVFLRGVRDDVQLLKNELEWMQCFIKDAEEKQVDDPMIRKWVSDIRDIAYDIEDVLDTFMVKVNERSSKTRGGIVASIRKCTCMFDEKSSNKKYSIYSKGRKMVNLYSIGKEIEVLRQRIGDLSRKRELYRLEDIGNMQEGKSNGLGKLKELRRATSFVVEENVVGFEDEANLLLAKLLGNEPQRFVISIFGMGGLGKTTLAKKLYHNTNINNAFNWRAWVSVSQDYQTEDLLRRIIKSFQINIQREELEKMSKEDLERYLHKSLQGCSYLVVIDDVWQKEAWESLKRAFPDGKNGSRVIITTRIKDVAERSDERIYAHELRFLSLDESWNLFYEKAFRNLNVDEKLEKLGREMVEKCGGLPLAIVVLGGLLSTKKLQEWRLVHDHIWRHLRNDSIHISYLLALSFHDLSYQLKLCFLYLGIFPEDCEIILEKAIRLLVAEGFIWQDEDQIMEELAKNYMDELINRSLIQIDNIRQGRVETFRIHDLLRDLAIQKAKQLNVFRTYDGIDHSTSSSNISSCRRLVFYSGTRFWFQHCNLISRSILLFDQYSGLFKEILPAICTRLRLLRVLHVENYRGPIDCRSLPEEIGQLIHLRYLTVRISLIENIPPCIAHLRRLQTLDLYSYNCKLKLPIEVRSLQELRHLIGDFEGPLPIDNLTNLQTLKFVSYKNWTEVNHPEKLINLRELNIAHYHEEGQEEFKFHSIAKLKALRILSVDLSSLCFFASLQPLSHCPRLLELTLDGKIERLPGDMDVVLPHLEWLSLRNSDLKDDPMPILEKLPNLVSLELLVQSYRGQKMICTAKGFPRLESLKLLGLIELEEWQADEGAMVMLRSLVIKSMNSKLRIPERLRSIPVPAKRQMAHFFTRF